MKTAPSFKTFLETQLNPEQQKAVIQKNGALLVIAGAGSGKTRVITARIAHLILHEGVDPQSIVALTFTNKAAKEMLERIEYFLGDRERMPFIGTFHSYCLNLLKRNQDKLDVPFFSILDEDDKQKLLSDIIKRNNVNKRMTGKQLAYQISQLKNKALTPENEHLKDDQLLQDLYRAYEHEKTLSKCLDFDDLLLTALNLFKKNPGFKKQFQERVTHILVDEYQDTNVVQHELLKHMALNEKLQFNAQSLCVVGDEDQSIYSWRGATVANILNFKKDFPDNTVIKIEQNYRSVQPILEVANTVIKHNKNRNPKKLWSEKKATNRIKGVACNSEYQEADVIAQFLTIAQKKQALDTIAILYRAHYQSRALEEAFIKNSIPYKILGGIQFYERKEIKDLLAYLRLVVNPFDRASLFRIINTPLRGLGQKFEEQFHQRWSGEPFLSFSDVCTKLIDEGMVVKTKKDAVQTFANVFNSIDNKTLPSKALDTIIARTRYISYLKDTYDKDEAQTRIDNINELIHAIKHFESNKVDTIELFLNEVALMQEHQLKKENSNKKPVLMMTLHAAKGLEFNTVILPGLEESILPSSRSLTNEDAVEEERRLFYVGITRARERLLLTHARYRYSYGQMNDQLQSRFLKEVPERLCTIENAAFWQTAQQRLFFAQWLGIDIPKSVMTFRTATSVKPKSTYATKTKQNIFAKKSFSNKPTFSKSRFKKNQPVQHKKFGMGIVQKVEKKDAATLYVTAKFKAGIKKIDAKFLTTI